MKRLVVVPVLAISVGLGIGCTDRAAQTALAELRAQAAVEQQNEALVRSVFDKLDTETTPSFRNSTLQSMDGIPQPTAPMP